MIVDDSNNIAINECIVLGIPLIDRQHANLIRITNNLNFACKKGLETANLRFINAVHEAVDYVKYHFSTEEKLMVLLEYPEHDQHKREHGDFIWEILSRAKQFEEGQDLVPEKFVAFLNNWIYSHIAQSDKMFADYFIGMNHHSKLRLILCGRPQLSANYA